MLDAKHSIFTLIIKYIRANIMKEYNCIGNVWIQ